MEGRTDMLSALRGGWWMVPLVFLAALVGAALLGEEQEPLYRSSATLAVVPDTSLEGTSDVLNSVEVLDRRTMVATLARLVASDVVRERAAGRMGRSLEELEPYRVDARVIPNTYLVDVSARGPEPETAARLAQSVAEAAVGEAGGYYRVFALRVLDRAATPRGPVARSEQRRYVVAGLLGLFVGVLAAFGVGLLRRA